MNPQYTNVKVEGPSFPTKGQLVFCVFFWKNSGKVIGGTLVGTLVGTLANY